MSRGRIGTRTERERERALLHHGAWALHKAYLALRVRVLDAICVFAESDLCWTRNGRRNLPGATGERRTTWPWGCAGAELSVCARDPGLPCTPPVYRISYAT